MENSCKMEKSIFEGIKSVMECENADSDAIDDLCRDSGNVGKTLVDYTEGLGALDVSNDANECSEERN